MMCCSSAAVTEPNVPVAIRSRNLIWVGCDKGTRVGRGGVCDEDMVRPSDRVANVCFTAMCAAYHIRLMHTRDSSYHRLPLLFMRLPVITVNNQT